MSSSLLQSYIANLAGRATAGMGAAAIPTGFLYQQRYSRSFLPFMRTPSNKVSRAVAQTAGVGSTFGYGDDEPTAADLSLRSSGDRIRDDNNDGIPDHINLISGSGDTFRVLDVTPGVMADLAAKYDAELKAREEEKYDSKLEAIVSGTTSYLKEKVAKEAGKLVGAPSTRFEMVTGRDVITGGLRTGVPLIDFMQPIGQKIYDEQILPDLEAAAAKAAMGQEGFGVFTLGGGAAVAITPDGIVDVGLDAFLTRTGRTRTQLENELRDKAKTGAGAGYLGSLYQSYITPVTTSTSVADIRGRTVYEDMILSSTLSDDLKSEMLGGADLRTTVTDSSGYEYTGFAGTVRFDASTGEVIKDNTPTGTYEEYYFDPPSEPEPEPDPPSTPPSYENTSSWNHGGSNETGADENHNSGGNSWDPPSSGNNWSSYIARGGHVTPERDMSKDSSTVQRTGFVAGSPDMFTESETVADTEYTMVRDGSFVLNAPIVEQLQKAGLLPSGVDKPKKNAKIKTDKRNLISVALSKGEVVLEPEEAAHIGYNRLEQINDLGKPEVDRRQASMGGKVGLASGGYSGKMSAGRVGFLGVPLPELNITGPSVQPSFADMGVEPSPKAPKSTHL